MTTKSIEADCVKLRAELARAAESVTEPHQLQLLIAAAGQYARSDADPADDRPAEGSESPVSDPPAPEACEADGDGDDAEYHQRKLAELDAIAAEAGPELAGPIGMVREMLEADEFEDGDASDVGNAIHNYGSPADLKAAFLAVVPFVETAYRNWKADPKSRANRHRKPAVTSDAPAVVTDPKAQPKADPIVQDITTAEQLIGMSVQVEYGGGWEDGTVIGTESGGLVVRYDKVKKDRRSIAWAPLDEVWVHIDKLLEFLPIPMPEGKTTPVVPGVVRAANGCDDPAVRELLIESIASRLASADAEIEQAVTALTGIMYPSDWLHRETVTKEAVTKDKAEGETTTDAGQPEPDEPELKALSDEINDLLRSNPLHVVTACRNALARHSVLRPTDQDDAAEPTEREDADPPKPAALPTTNGDDLNRVAEILGGIELPSSNGPPMEGTVKDCARVYLESAVLAWNQTADVESLAQAVRILHDGQPAKASDSEAA